MAVEEALQLLQHLLDVSLSLPLDRLSLSVESLSLHLSQRPFSLPLDGILSHLALHAATDAQLLHSAAQALHLLDGLVKVLSQTLCPQHISLKAP